MTKTKELLLKSVIDLALVLLLIVGVLAALQPSKTWSRVHATMEIDTEAPTIHLIDSTGVDVGRFDLGDEIVIRVKRRK